MRFVYNNISLLMLALCRFTGRAVYQKSKPHGLCLFFLQKKAPNNFDIYYFLYVSQNLNLWRDETQYYM
jgi:hypothetical protein